LTNSSSSSWFLNFSFFLPSLGRCFSWRRLGLPWRSVAPRCSIRYRDEDDGAGPANSRVERTVFHVADKVTTSLNLDNVSLLKAPQLGIADHLHLSLSLLANKVLEVVIFLQYCLPNNVVIVDGNSRGWGRLLLINTEPGQLHCFLEVLILSVVIRINRHNLPILSVDLLHHQVAPVDKRSILSLLQEFCVCSINDHLGPGPDVLLADLRVLGMPGRRVRGKLSSSHSHRDIVLLVDRGVPRHDRVEHLLVERPDLVPLHEHDALAAALGYDELFESFYGETPPQNTPHGW